MSRPHVSPAVLADKGVPLTLADGLSVRLCFSFKALMLLEERYGSLEAAAALMGGATDDDGRPAKSAPFGTIAGILACGLAHEVEPEHGRPLSDADVLADYLETDKITAYSDAIGEGFTRAFPAADPTPPAGGETPAPTAPPVEDSRGASGTGSPAFASASPMTSSGA